jgi:hypothetical protein
MSISFAIGICVGTAISNIFTGRLLWRLNWLKSTGYGMLSGVICAILWGLLALFGMEFV